MSWSLEEFLSLPEPVEGRMDDAGWEVRLDGELLYCGAWTGAQAFVRNHDLDVKFVKRRVTATRRKP